MQTTNLKPSESILLTKYKHPYMNTCEYKKIADALLRVAVLSG